MNYKFIILALSCLFSCKQYQTKETKEEKTENIENIKVIDLESNFKFTNEKMKLSDAVSGVEYIPLETTNRSLVSDLYRIKIKNGLIFASSNIFHQVYLFDNKGIFIRTLGNIGQGPGEYNIANSYSCNDSIIYISASGRDIKMYNWKNNKYIGNIPCKNIGNIHALSNNEICLFIDSHASIKKIFTSLIVNNKNDTISYLRPQIDTEELNKLSEWVYTQRLCTWETKDGINVYEFNNDTIYRISTSGIQTRYKLNLGKFKMPDKTFYNKAIRFDEEKKYFTIRSFAESSEYLYIEFNYQENDIYAQYNKTNNNIKFWNLKSIPNLGSGFYNDIDGGPIVFLNRQTEGDYIWRAITPELAESYLTSEHFASMEVKFPEKRDELQKLLKNIKEDDNPIIAIYKLK